ncbi:MAG: fructosamine kinase family protein [Candidatus Eremiobacteraeota bacterium]|nr:fructosamine kinase family protein [Candidatus Eremiobacteraeota bacterium]MCW5866587.1 fructosamine kinase family protein [Candidatus Eremiobacteraeota bacterium]
MKTHRKTRPGVPPDFFAAEAHGLEWLRAATSLRVPEVLEVGPDFLLMEWLESAPAVPDYEERLGRGLAELHRTGGPPGLERDNFVGTLPQVNRTCAGWCEFYIERRLRPLLLDRWRDRFERLFAVLPGWLPDEGLSRLHGDLWAGNVLVGPAGEPCLIDPAVYVGHREVDLAMMRLFGGFGPRVWASYAEAFPLSAGYTERIPLYQLYPLLVHVHLFGGGYAAQVEQALARLPG